MTDNNNKIRSIVLAALMVFSVFAGSIAFAGTAAAAPAVAGGSLSPNSVDEGTTNDHDVTVNISDVNLSDGSNDASVVVQFPNSVDLNSSSVTNQAVVGNESGSSGTTNVASNLNTTTNELNITFDDSNGNASETITVSFTITDVQAPNVASTTNADIGLAADTNADGTDEVTAASALQLEVVAASQSGSADVTLTSTSDKPLVWAGQTVGVSAFADSTDVQLRRNTSSGSTLVVQKNTGADGFVSFNTADRPTGDYFVTDGSTSYNFELATQELSVDFAADSVDNGGSSTTVAFDAESNRANYEHVLEATYEGDAVAASTLQSILGGAGTLKDVDSDDADELVVAGTSSDSFTANFSGASAGNYTVTSTVNDTGVSDSTTVTVQDVSSGNAEFVNSTYSTPEGDIVAIDIELTGAASSGTVVIGDEASEGYQANVSFTDENDDGEVTVMFNTYTAGSSGSVVSAAGDDTATLNGQTGIGALLAQGDYTLAVSTASTAADTTDEPQDLGALVIGERSTDSVKLWTAPGSADLDADGESGVTESDIATLIEDGMVTEAGGTVTAGDYTVHQVSASGLEGLVDSEGNLSAALESGNVTLSIVQTNPVQNSEPKTVDVANSTLTLVEGDGAYYIVAKTSGLQLEDTSKSIVAGDEFMATFTVADDRLLRSSEDSAHQSVNTTFEVVAPSTSLDSDPVQVGASSAQTITGTTNYAPGTELTVRVRSSSDVTPGFFNSKTVMVQADGTFNASFDFSEQATGDTFAVTVRKGGTNVASADGEVVEASTETPTATATAEPDTDTATATATATAEPTDTATATATDEPDTETDTETSTETPGFGVAVALVALLAAALLAGRRE